MPKLKTYGVITEEEYRSAERDGRFRITDHVVCSYCQEPVSVETDTPFLYCRTHYQLALSMYWYPGYPAVPMDAPRYRQMDFRLSQLERNRPLFDRETPEEIATEKGCPFCDRYMLPVNPIVEGQRDRSLLNVPLFCPDCGVSFQIQVITADDGEVQQMRFQVEDKHLPPTETNNTDAPLVCHERHNTLPAEKTHRPLDTGDTDAEDPDTNTTFPPTVETRPLRQNAPKDIEGQILALLPKDGKAMRPKEILANIDGNRKNMYAALNRLEKKGDIKIVARGAYARAGSRWGTNAELGDNHD